VSCFKVGAYRSSAEASLEGRRIEGGAEFRIVCDLNVAYCVHSEAKRVLVKRGFMGSCAPGSAATWSNFRQGYCQ